jgi:predicted phosphodiesterase
MRILCISDVHGHYGALAAVLAAADERGFAKVLVAGDIVFPGPEPLETWRRLTQLGAVMVQGVSDRAIATLDPDRLQPKSENERHRLERMRQTRADLGELILERLKRLPTTARMTIEDGSELLVVHGSPADPDEAMSHDMSDEELGALLGDDPADIVVCGMTHVPFDRTVAGVRILNVGSVGEAPDQGSFAHATIIETRPSGIVVEPLVVRLAPVAKAVP